MKIIGRDNYNRETESDILVAENVHGYYGKLIVQLLNEREYDTYFDLVEDDRKLYDASTLY